MTRETILWLVKVVGPGPKPNRSEAQGIFTSDTAFGAAQIAVGRIQPTERDSIAELHVARIGTLDNAEDIIAAADVTPPGESPILPANG